MSWTLDLLRSLNDMPIRDVNDPLFASYGRVIGAFDASPLLKIMEEQTPIPETGNVYVASEPLLENAGNVMETLQNTVYGGMPIQIGYCNGVNSTYNGFEYHKGSEVNVAVTDLCLVLGHVWQIQNNTFSVNDAEVFFVPAGTAIEMYATTLHLSPCRVQEEGFRDVVVLPRGTNTPLKEKPQNPAGEDRLLLETNKWIIAHPEREPLIRRGAYPGVIGENKEIRYKEG